MIPREARPRLNETATTDVRFPKFKPLGFRDYFLT
jgi:hypothetical protein